MKRPGKVVKTIKTKKGRFEIYEYKGKKKKQFGTRLIAGNGVLIGSNRGFNNVQNAMKNINAIRRAAI